jgi:uncharacterized protein (TIGR00255 family)
MINSMTAFGSARSDLEQGSLALEIRSVNSRFLDLYFRLPDELRHAETALRDLLTAQLGRGKLELRITVNRAANAELTKLDPAWLKDVADQLQAARAILPELAAPRLVELFNWPGQKNNESLDPVAWGTAALEAARQALTQLQEARAREGHRLAAVMQECANGIGNIVAEVESHLPQLLEDHRSKLANKLRETMENAFPGGFGTISAKEMTERLSQEASLFALRIDVAEELARLRSHLTELTHILDVAPAAEKPAEVSASQPIPATGGAVSKSAKSTAKSAAKRPSGSAGKRLDFLFQEMNREANTLGSKAASLEVTRAAMDLKLLIEQMREQAQNIE